MWNCGHKFSICKLYQQKNHEQSRGNMAYNYFWQQIILISRAFWSYLAEVHELLEKVILCSIDDEGKTQLTSHNVIPTLALNKYSQTLFYLTARDRSFLFGLLTGICYKRLICVVKWKFTLKVCSL